VLVTRATAIDPAISDNATVTAITSPSMVVASAALTDTSPAATTVLLPPMNAWIPLVDSLMTFPPAPVSANATPSIGSVAATPTETAGAVASMLWPEAGLSVRDDTVTAPPAVTAESVM